MKYLPGLNGVRAVSVLAVVWHHSRPSGLRWAAAGNGFLGVDIFFVLSGFLITALLLEEDEKEGEVSLYAFYWRRSLRIFPLYLAVLGCLSLYYYFSTGSSQRIAFMSELPTNLLFLSNWFPSSTLMSVGWSLSTEEQFYLAWPPLVAFFGRRSLMFLLAFLVVNQAVNFGLIPVGGSKSITQVTFTPIILGSMLAFGMSSGRVRPWLQASTARWRIYAALIGLVAIAVHPGDLQGAPRLCFHVLAAWLLCGIVTWPGSGLVRLLEWRPLAYIGTVSYGVYLLHESVLDRVVRGLSVLHLDDRWNFPACMLATLLVAGLSYRYFERPLLRLKVDSAAARLPSPVPAAP